MNIQYIEQNGIKQYAVIPMELFEELTERAEMLDDIKTLNEVLATDEEMIPHELLKKLLAGENQLKVWREYRGFTQIDLATQTGLEQATIEKIETGQQLATPADLKKLATVLMVDVDDLIVNN